MNWAIANICLAASLLPAPCLLALRFFFPRRFSWAIVVTSAVGIGWALLILAAHFTKLGWERCEHLGAAGEHAVGCFVDGRADRSFGLGWIAAAVYLAFWLVAYFIAHRIRTRSRTSTQSPPNKSLERTRAG